MSLLFISFIQFHFAQSIATGYDDKSGNRDERKTEIKLKCESITLDNIEEFSSNFISFDTETTGLNPENDKIIEIGACHFVNGVLKSSFGSLVKSVNSIPVEASKVNHITNDMLFLAPKEKTVIDDFVKFINPAINENAVLVAHNAFFDIGFLANTLKRLGYGANIRFIDTLDLSRETIPYLYNHKQNTILDFYSIQNSNAHRAQEDAEACGYMFLKLCEDRKLQLEKTEEKQNNNSYKYKAYTNTSEVNYESISPNEEEKELCSIIKRILIENDKDTDKVYFYKNSAGIMDAKNGWLNYLQFKVGKKSKYVLIEKNNIIEGYQIEEKSKKEGNGNEVRMVFENPMIFRELESYIIEKYDETVKEQKYYPPFDTNSTLAVNTLCDCDLAKLEENAYKRYEDYVLTKEKEKEEKAILEKERIRKEEEKEKRRIEREQKELEKLEAINNGTYNPTGRRAICRMNDNGEILETYESLTAAIEKTGINSKSIRDAAKGVQKHAGGYVWKYKDQIE